jgi:hypothetical protein
MKVIYLLTIAPPPFLLRQKGCSNITPDMFRILSILHLFLVDAEDD